MNFFSEIGEDPIEFFSDKSEATRLKAISARGCVALTVPAGTAWLVAKGFQPLIRSRWPTVFTGEFYLSASGKYSFAQWRGDYCRVLHTLPRAAEEFPTPNGFKAITGRIIGSARLVRCVADVSVPETPFAFEIDSPHIFDSYIPQRGRPGFFYPKDAMPQLVNMRDTETK